jgi:hypothetical protein
MWPWSTELHEDQRTYIAKGRFLVECIDLISTCTTGGEVLRRLPAFLRHRTKYLPTITVVVVDEPKVLSHLVVKRVMDMPSDLFVGLAELLGEDTSGTC